MKALFIGRFQPFHLGHLHIIQHIASTYEHIFIGVGSSQYSYTYDNPFSFEERKLMITEILHEQGIQNFAIIAIPDVHDPPNWVAHVKKICPPFDIVITNNDFTASLFKEKGYATENTPLFDRKNLAGKEIRNRIRNNQEWESLVPIIISRLIKKKLDGIHRIQAYSKKNKVS
ncbi:MAG: nicotinamide-nucleotide adenylyltransferase [Candidatus Thermoplasmatota archaeon]|nr:nicotinamide-nucleotide adenylyltransferase [Candidatus Thermoplasmatota archaeon]MBU1940197.1 nicotinamide-nucleotide adenylyltransferase [Candidatus Thermoplasmatota archaeon]